MKTCSKCGISKPLSDFHLHSSHSDGHRSACKNCLNKKQHPAEWWQQTAEEKRAVQRKRDYQENRAQNKERLQRWREAHPELTRVHSRTWHASHPEVQRERSLLNNFGITLKEYNTMLDSQDGVCAICQRPERVVDHRTGKPKNLAVDHDHLTGDIRGLLCQFCNHAIGSFREDVECIARAIEYLERAVKQRKIGQLKLFGD